MLCDVNRMTPLRAVLPASPTLIKTRPHVLHASPDSSGARLRAAEVADLPDAIPPGSSELGSMSTAAVAVPPSLALAAPPGPSVAWTIPAVPLVSSGAAVPSLTLASPLLLTASSTLPLVLSNTREVCIFVTDVFTGELVRRKLVWIMEALRSETAHVVGKSLELVLGQRLDGSCVATDNTKVMLFVQVNVVLNRQIDGNLKQKRPAARTNAMWLGGAAEGKLSHGCGSTHLDGQHWSSPSTAGPQSSQPALWSFHDGW